VIAQLKKIETPIKTRGIHPTGSCIHVELTGVEGIADVTTIQMAPKHHTK
jgi:hypothetical protein